MIEVFNTLMQLDIKLGHLFGWWLGTQITACIRRWWRNRKREHTYDQEHDPYA